MKLFFQDISVIWLHGKLKHTKDHQDPRLDLFLGLLFVHHTKWILCNLLLFGKKASAFIFFFRQKEGIVGISNEIIWKSSWKIPWTNPRQLQYILWYLPNCYTLYGHEEVCVKIKEICIPITGDSQFWKPGQPTYGHQFQNGSTGPCALPGIWLPVKTDQWVWETWRVFW
jgi:hypothetical protein